MKPVLVTWQDATSSDAWEDMDEAVKSELHTIHTLGWHVFEDDKKLIVGLNWDKERDAVSQTITIPKSWIQTFRYLRVKVK